MSKPNYLCKIHKEMLIYKQLIPLTPYNALCTNCLKKNIKGYSYPLQPIIYPFDYNYIFPMMCNWNHCIYATFITKQCIISMIK